jgi:hypothetical protein
MLCIDARKISVDGEIFDLKSEENFKIRRCTKIEEEYSSFIEYKDIHCVALVEDPLENVDYFIKLFRNRIYKLIVSSTFFWNVELENGLLIHKISYQRIGGYTIIDSIQPEQERYVLELFMDGGGINTWAVLCLGEGVTYKREKVKRNKLIEYLFGERWDLTYYLAPSSACAFIQCDGAELTILGNEFEVKNEKLDPTV